jgi:hypothetical protein
MSPAAARNKQKFFGSFFQKRTACFLRESGQRCISPAVVTTFVGFATPGRKLLRISSVEAGRAKFCAASASIKPASKNNEVHP